MTNHWVDIKNANLIVAMGDYAAEPQPVRSRWAIDAKIPNKAKLTDVRTCIASKGCQVACSEWNNIRDEMGHNVGVYDNPLALTAKSWTGDALC